LKTEEILGLVNVIFYAVHIVVFSTLGYKQGKANGVKSVILILIFLLVLFFVSIQVGGFIAQIFFIGKEMTSKLKSIHDTLVIIIATVIELPIWFTFFKKKRKHEDETENDSFDSPR